MAIDPTFLPAGSEAIQMWARARGLGYEARPNLQWFRSWEPFDMLVSPHHYFSACTWTANPGSVTLVEPWFEDDADEPIDRTIFAFAIHPQLRYRASMRVGEHFVTRVSFLTDPPPPEVEVGDPVWDEHVVTRSISKQEAAAAFRTGVRQLLRSWGFQGHIEMRPGGLLLYAAGFKPMQAHFEQLISSVPQVVRAALHG